MVLLARSALDRAEGKGSEALRKAMAAGEAAAARQIVVDATDNQAVAFYARHGFVAAPVHSRRRYAASKMSARLDVPARLAVKETRYCSRSPTC